MGRSLNKAQIIGRLGRDPETRTFANGGSVVSFPVATSDTWRDKRSGELREKTEWHRVAIYNEALGRIATAHLKKGDMVYLEGKMETRKWQDQQGNDRYTTEIALRPYAGDMTLLGGSGEGGRRRAENPSGERPQAPGGGRREGRPPVPADLYSGSRGYAAGGYRGDFPDDDIPF